jgi:hypothetical protein
LVTRFIGRVLICPLAFLCSYAFIELAHQLGWRPEYLVKELAFMMVPHELYLFFSYYLCIGILALPLWLVLDVVFLELMEQHDPKRARSVKP